MPVGDRLSVDRGLQPPVQMGKSTTITNSCPEKAAENQPERGRVPTVTTFGWMGATGPVLAFLVACAFALGTVLQQQGTLDTTSHDGHSSWLIQILHGTDALSATDADGHPDQLKVACDALPLGRLHLGFDEL